jgi:hypothetical protein
MSNPICLCGRRSAAGTLLLYTLFALPLWAQSSPPSADHFLKLPERFSRTLLI